MFMFSASSQPGKNRGEPFGRIREQISENPRLRLGFSLAREFSQTLPRFSTGYEGAENMFYFFYKIIIFRLD